MSLNINAKMCSTCVFGEDSPLTDERFVQYEEIWHENGVHQECHHFTVKDERVGCRGHYEAAKRGKYPTYPVILEMEKLGIRDLPAKDVFQIAERLGLIRFVKEEE